MAKDYYHILGVPKNARQLTGGQPGDIIIVVKVK